MEAVYAYTSLNADSLFLKLSPLADIIVKQFLHSTRGCLGTSEELPALRHLKLLLFLSRKAEKLQW